MFFLSKFSVYLFAFGLKAATERKPHTLAAILRKNLKKIEL